MPAGFHQGLRQVLGDVLANYWYPIVLCVLIISGATITQYFFSYAATYAITTMRFGAGVAMGATLTNGVMGTIFAVVGGLMADRYGVKAIAIVPRILVTVLLYPMLHLVVASGSPVLFIVGFGLLMAPHAMSAGAGIVLIPKIFPPLVRTSGLAIAYALGVTLFGGTAQVVFTWIINATGDKLSWVWYIITMSVVSLIATVLIRVPLSWAVGAAAPGDAPATSVKVTP